MISRQGEHPSSPICEGEIERITEVLADPPALSHAERMAMWAALWNAPRLNRMAHISEVLQPMLALVPPRRGAA